jgi:glycosyltransferase
MKIKYIHFTQLNRAINYGIGTYIDNIIYCFRNIGFDFEIVELLSREGEIKITNLDGYRKISIPAFNKWHIDKYKNYYSRNTAFLLKTIFVEEDIFYIFHLNCMDNEFLPVWLKKLFKCKIVLTVHYTEWSFKLLGDYEKLRDIMKKNVKEIDFAENIILTETKRDKKLAESCDYLICPAHHTSQYFKELHSIEASKISVIPHGLLDQYTENNMEAQEALRHKYHFAPQTKIVLYAGRLDEVKGVIFLIKAFKKVLETNENIHLFIAGDGDFNQLITAAQDICTKVTFSGKLDRKRLYELYNIVDIGAVCSIHEEFGYIALEMMMHEIPLIVTDTGGLSEIIKNNVTGIKIPIVSGDNKRIVDIEALSEKINLLLHNPTLRKEIGQAGRKEFLEKYQIPIYKTKMLNFYEKISLKIE